MFENMTKHTSDSILAMMKEYSKMMEKGIDPNGFAEAMKTMGTKAVQSAPTFKPNKNGYEIRTKVLEMAQGQMWQDYHAKWGAYETSVKMDGDEIVTEVTMPEVPGTDAVLEAAEKFYGFVTNGNK